MEGRSSTVAFSALEAIAQAHDFLVGLPLISSGKGIYATKSAGPPVIVRKAQRHEQVQPRQNIATTVVERPPQPPASRLGASTRVASSHAVLPAHHVPVAARHQAAPVCTAHVSQVSIGVQPQQQQQQQRQLPPPVARVQHATPYVQQQQQQSNTSVLPSHLCRPWKSTPRAVPATQPIPAVAAPGRIQPVKSAATQDSWCCSPSDLDVANEPAAPPAVSQVLQRIKQLMQPTNMQEHQFYSDCYRACQSVGGLEDGCVSIPKVALALRVCGHRVVVRKVLDSKAYWTKAMTNMFCYSLLPGLEGGYIVEPNFRQMLCTGFMTERYRDIWECLPAIFVGRAAQLASLVQLLCQEMATSFEADERVVPPWRTYSASIIRWLSKSFTDIPTPPLPDGGGIDAELRAVRRFQEKCEQLRAVDMASSARGSKTRWYRTSSGTWVSIEGAEGVCGDRPPDLVRPGLPGGAAGDEGMLKIVIARSGARKAAEVLLRSPSHTQRGFQLGPASHPCDALSEAASSSQPPSATASDTTSTRVASDEGDVRRDSDDGASSSEGRAVDDASCKGRGSLFCSGSGGGAGAGQMCVDATSNHSALQHTAEGAAVGTDAGVAVPDSAVLLSTCTLAAITEGADAASLRAAARSGLSVSSSCGTPKPVSMLSTSLAVSSTTM